MNNRFYTKVYIFAAALTAGFSAHAGEDVTSQYITNPGFEACPTATIIDGTVQLITNDKTPVDYEEYGWKCIGGGFQNTSNYNAGVATYPIKVKYSKWLSGLEGPETSPVDGDNTKALCFTGNGAAVYQSATIELPAGTYTLTVNVWAYNGGSSNQAPTIDIVGATGFITENGTEYLSEKKNFLSSGWDTDIIKIELTEATKGYFQLSYGAAYFAVVDDLKLEYEAGVITTALETVIDKADALNEILDDEALTDAIKAAIKFVANPTTQDDVAVQIQTLYAAMNAALTERASELPIDITAAFLENASFENGIAPWEGTAHATEPSSSLPMTPNIDGSNIACFDYDASKCQLWQQVDHLPAGFYLVETLLSSQAKIQLGGSASATWTGGSDGLYLHVYSPIVELTEEGSLLVGAAGTTKTSFDNFRLLYAKDEATLQQAALAVVTADAQLWLAKSEYSNITGSERLAINVSIEDEYDDVMTQIAEINSNIAAFISAKDNYNKWVAAKENAAVYTEEAYPYAKAKTYQQVQSLINTTVNSGDHAADLKDLLSEATRELIISNAYCEGIEDATDYTDKIIGANASGEGVPSAWQTANMTIRSDKTAWVNPKTQESDQTCYGTTASYYTSSKGTKSSMRQIVSGLPKGKYALSITYMSPAPVSAVVTVDGLKIGTLTGVGMYGGGIYGAGWTENVVSFEKEDDDNIILRIEYEGTANYQEWYFDNLRLFRVDKDEEDIEVGISQVTSIADETVFDLQGRRVARPAKGIYIVGEKKVVR